MASKGARKLSPTASKCGGLTWSYHPPYSSHEMNSTVEFHSGDPSKAFTTEALQFWPSDRLLGAWSDCQAAGMIQEMLGRVPAEASAKNWEVVAKWAFTFVA